MQLDKSCSRWYNIVSRIVLALQRRHTISFIWSHSRYITYLSCPRKYEFKYILGLEEPETPSLAIGKAYHEIVANLYKGKPDLAVAVSKKYSVDPVLIGSLVEAYRPYMANYAPYVIEEHVMTEFAPDVYLQGHVDLITEDEVIVDHKTASKRWPEYRSHLDLQPNAYYILYESLMGKPPRHFEFHIVTKTVIPKVQILETSRSQDTLEWYKECLLEALDAINTGIFPPNPSYMYCSEKYCPFWKPCRSPAPCIKTGSLHAAG